MSERQRRSYARQQRGAQRGNDLAGPLVLGMLLILAGAFFLARNYIPAIDWGQVWPIGLVVLGVLLVVLSLFTGRRARA